MIEKDKKTDLGIIKIHNNVIAQIATIASKEVEGVIDMERGFVSNFFGSILGGAVFNKSVRVEVYENDIRVSISVIVEYGSNIPLIATKVQENVKTSLERMAGLSPIEINVNVKEVKSVKK
ncbi:MAG: Asp23/Gls24 family envelope stress response protein [Candidatus Omnitrophica bacterium]|nr:Asp23/Gls24 family envelope stress response protein [Candidatus Omnitrophota bacterium]